MPRHTPAKNAALDAAMYYRSLDTDDVAEAMRIDVQTVRRWLRQESTPTGAHLAALLTLLDAPSRLLDAPPLNRQAALALMGTWDELQAQRAEPQPDPLPPEPPRASPR